jgi:hypothetical protein
MAVNGDGAQIPLCNSAFLLSFGSYSHFSPLNCISSLVLQAIGHLIPAAPGLLGPHGAG